MFTPPLLSVSTGPDWALDPAMLSEKISLLGGDWYDSFHFDNGVVIDGRSPSPAKLNAMFLPPRLNGLRVLDVGAYNGYYSFHLEQRGATVTSNDHFIWRDQLVRKQYDLIHEATGSSAEVIDAEFTELGDR